MRQIVDKFPTTALQICCFPNGPEALSSWPLRQRAARNVLSSGQTFGQQWSTPCGTGTTSWSEQSVAGRRVHWGSQSPHRSPSRDRAPQGDQGPGHEETAAQSFPGHRSGSPASCATGLCSHWEVQHACARRIWHDVMPAQAGRREGEAPGEPVHHHWCLRGTGVGATLVRPMPPTCLVVATAWSCRIFGLCATLAAWPVPAKESRIQPLGAWIRAFNLACMTPRAVTSCTMKTELTLPCWLLLHSLGVRWEAL